MMRISEQWRHWIEEVLITDPTKDVLWDLGLAVLPDPSVRGQFVGFMAIEVMIDGGTIEVDGQQTPSVITTRGLLPPFALREQVEHTLKDLLSDVRARRNVEPTESPNTAQWAPQISGTETL